MRMNPKLRNIEPQLLIAVNRIRVSNSKEENGSHSNSHAERGGRCRATSDRGLRSARHGVAKLREGAECRTLFLSPHWVGAVGHHEHEQGHPLGDGRTSRRDYLASQVQHLGAGRSYRSEHERPGIEPLTQLGGVATCRQRHETMSVVCRDDQDRRSGLPILRQGARLRIGLRSHRRRARGIAVPLLPSLWKEGAMQPKLAFCSQCGYFLPSPRPVHPAAHASPLLPGALVSPLQWTYGRCHDPNRLGEGPPGATAAEEARQRGPGTRHGEQSACPTTSTGQSVGWKREYPARSALRCRAAGAERGVLGPRLPWRLPALPPTSPAEAASYRLIGQPIHKRLTRRSDSHRLPSDTWRPLSASTRERSSSSTSALYRSLSNDPRAAPVPPLVCANRNPAGGHVGVLTPR